MEKVLRYLGISLCFTFILVYPGYWATAQPIQFKHLGIQEGLSQNTVNCMMQDSQGFLWIGTQDGLNRYDGYNFKIYRSNPVDSNSIAHNWIWDIFEDHEKNIWIATWDGLTKYDPSINKFKNYLPRPGASGTISGSRPTSICEDQMGSLWIGTWGGGLNRYNSDSETFTVFKHDSANSKSLPNNYIRNIYFDQHNRLWVGTWGGLSRVSIDKDKSIIFLNFLHSKSVKTSISSNKITYITEDHLGNLWIATLGGGLNIYSEKDSSFQHFYHQKNRPNSLSSNDISVIFEDHLNQLWIGTPSNGLNLFNRKNGICTRFVSSQEDRESLNGNNVYSIYEDISGLLWIGGSGINIYDPQIGNFQSLKFNNNDRNTLSKSKVTSFCEDQSGNIWLGTEYNGLKKYNRTTGTFTIYQHNPRNQNSLSNNNVSSITRDKNGRIWVGTRGGGLNLFQPQKGNFVHFIQNPEIPETEGLNYINALCFTQENLLWIATYDKGLICYDIQKNHFSHFKSNSRDRHSLTGNYLLRLYTDSHGKLWIGTWGAGLCCLDPETNRFTSFLADDKDTLSIAGNIIHTICETEDSGNRIMWAGTSKGLSSMILNDSMSGKFNQIDMRDGLPSNVINGILEDGHRNIWLSTNMGISMLNPVTKKIINYDVNDGLQSNEFNRGACLKLKDGSLLFGGVTGINSFFPDQIKESSFQPPVVLTNFLVFNKEMKFSKSLNELSHIVLSFKQNFFSFEFSALDFSQPGKIQYAYQMTGVDKDWVMAGKRRYASYTNIGPGEYIFKVRGTNSDGIWSKKLKSINIKIKPPYWQTWWFKVLGLVLLSMVLYTLHRMSIQKLLAIERLRVRIASDLHDDIGSALTRISITSEQIQNTKNQNKMRILSKSIGSISRDVISTMGDIVWSIDSRNDSLMELLDRMHEFTYNDLSLEDMNIVFHQEGLDENKKISVDYRQNIFYIFKEVINNAVKHSGASEIEINLSNRHDFFMMEIADNGKGFDPEKIKNGNGLRNIRMRARRLKADLDIDAKNGVSVILKMKKL